MSPTNPSWVDRMRMINTTSVEVDQELAASILLARVKAGLSIRDHVKALADASDRADGSHATGSALDFAHLRSVFAVPETMNDNDLLFAYFRADNPDPSFLRFVRPPDGFAPQRYRALNRDLADFSDRKLVDHFLRCGRAEGRAW
jgi:hypothetical protein